LESSFELKLSFIVVFFLAAVYVAYEAFTIPSGGHPFGHALGILGAILMVMAETLYSIRKRTNLIRFGRVRHWLSFHIFCGIVGPALVLMHTGMEFRGLAGFTFWMTVIVVASGFLGRYIYTAVPRSLAGVEVDRRALEAEVAQQRAVLLDWSQGKSAQVQELVARETALSQALGDAGVLEVLTRRGREWQEQRRVRRSIHRLNKEERARMKEIEQMLRQQRRLARQIRSLQTVRQLMGLWHTVHVPLGLTLFAAMTIHIVATIYYGALS